MYNFQIYETKWHFRSDWSCILRKMKYILVLRNETRYET